MVQGKILLIVLESVVTRHRASGKYLKPHVTQGLEFLAAAPLGANLDTGLIFKLKKHNSSVLS